MRKISVILSLLFFGFASSYAQKTNNFFIGLGLNATTFQDTKYSDTRYNGGGGALEIGFQKIKPNATWEGGLSVIAGSQSATTHLNGQTLLINPTFYFSYLQNINDKFSVGGRWDILDFTFRQTSDLQNNSIYYIAANQLYASGKYKISIGDKMVLHTGLDLGLLSFAKESTGFAFSAPQSGLEDGEFNYQNEALSNPFSVKYYVARPLWNYFNIRTTFDLQFNDRLLVGYHWNMREFASVKDYPTTLGSHALVVRYNIRHRTKTTDKF